jgi:hypothetical protein
MKSEPANRLDTFALRHPVLLAVATLALAAVATVLFLSSSQGQAVLYQAF